MELNAGEIVCSKAGRDKGKYFVVMETMAEGYAALCDGKLRKVDKPKKKKIKHLAKTGETAAVIADKLAAGERVTNPELRRALGRMNSDANV